MAGAADAPVNTAALESSEILEGVSPDQRAVDDGVRGKKLMINAQLELFLVAAWLRAMLLQDKF